MLKEFFLKDSIATGLLTGLGSLLLMALLLTAGILIANEPVDAHLSWYAGCFIPPLLIMRFYIKLQKTVTVKTIMVLLFVTFIPFILFLFKTHSLNF